MRTIGIVFVSMGKRSSPVMKGLFFAITCLKCDGLTHSGKGAKAEHLKPFLIRGVLKHRLLPKIEGADDDQVDRGAHAKFIVVDATLERIHELLADENPIGY